MTKVWPDPPKKRSSPMDSGNNGSAVGRFVKKLLEPKPKPPKAGKKGTK